MHPGAPLHRSEIHGAAQDFDAVFVGTGFFQGKLYDIGRYPGAIRSRRNTDRVIGEIYQFSEPRRALEILDEYEGHRFKRKRVTIFQEDGKSIGLMLVSKYGNTRKIRVHRRSGAWQASEDIGDPDGLPLPPAMQSVPGSRA